MKSIQWLKIEDLDIYISDGNYSSKYPRSSEFVNSGIPFIRANNFLNKTISPKEMYFITPEKHQALLKGHIKTDDVLITTRGDLGKTALVPESYNDANINAQIVLLRANPHQIDPKFLIWCFDIPEVKFQITQLQTGTALQQLPVGKLIKIKIPLPPIAEQKRIAEILDRTQSLISKRKEAIAKLDTLTQSIFLEMFGDPVRNLKQWKRVPFSELLENIDSGWSPVCLDRPVSGEEWGVLKLGAVTWCEYNPNENKAIPIDIKPKPELEVKAGDILFTRKNTYELVAACVLVRETLPRLMMPDLIFRFRLRSDADIDSCFLHQLLIYPTKRINIQKLAGGSSGSMPNISKAKLQTISIEIPPLPLQKEFAQRVEAVEKLKATHRASLSQLEALFASLQHRAFRGEL